MKLLLALSLTALALAGCDKAAEPSSPPQAGAAPAQCLKDTDCKGDRICDDGKCTSPQAASPLVAAPAAPAMAYEPLLVTESGVADVFTLKSLDTLGQAINYQSRAGVVNVMEYVVDDVEVTGYVAIEKAYAFGGKYLLIVSTGEGGNACPASTYAFTFDTATESVQGKTQIDGCSENVEALAEGNKLTVKKEGSASVFYNAQVK